MGIHESPSAFRAIAIARTPVPQGEHPFPNFVTAARALWPHKTAAHLAALAGVTERAAKFWLAGDREPSAEAFMAVFNRIAERHR